MNGQPSVWLVEAPVILDVHRHERGDVKVFDRAISFVAEWSCNLHLIVGFTEQITILLAPWSIVDFSDDVLDTCVILVIAVVKADWIETKSEITAVSQQAYRAIALDACPFVEHVTYSLLERYPCIAKMV